MIDEKTGVRLVRSKSLSDRLHTPTDVLSFSGTTTGTHKEIKAEEAFKRFPNEREFIAITSGNYGAALKHVAEKEKKMVRLIVENNRGDLVPKLRGDYTTVCALGDLQGCLTWAGRSPDLFHFPVGMGYENLTGDRLSKAFRIHARRVHGDEKPIIPKNITENQEIYGITPSVEELVYLVDSRLVDLRAYEHIVVPAGSGELLHDISKQTSSATVTGIVPHKHPLLTRKDFDGPVLPSFADKLTTPVAPMRMSLDYLSKKGHDVRIAMATETELRQANKVALEEGLDSEISGSAGLASTLNSFRKRNSFSPTGNVLIINTGNGERNFS